MADLIAVANGNLTSSSTWGVVDTTSKLDSEASSTALTTSYVASSNFTPGAITIDGFAVKVLNRASSPTGTIDLNLRNTTDSTDVATVSINVSDIPADAITNNNGGWVFIYIGSTLLTAGKNYAIRAKTSSSTQISLYRDATAGNWSRLLRTTTTAAPAAADNMFIMGEWTAAATKTDRTVTMDETATTDYGKMEVCLGGKLTWGTTGSTNYYLKLSGNYNQYGGGTTEVGTTGTPIPSTSTAVIEFDCSTNVEFGMELYGGTFTMQGASKTVKAMLAADASASATSLTTDVSTGWKSGDEIALASTTRTASECEKKSLTADASGTTLTISALTNAHGGNSTTKVQAELANITRNVRIRGISSSNQSYINFRTATVIDWDYVEIYNFGSNTSNKRGITVVSSTTQSGSHSIQYCSFHDFTVTGSSLLLTGATLANLVFSNNVTYLIDAEHFTIVATSINTVTFDNNLFIRSTSTSASMVAIFAAILSSSGNTVVGCAATSVGAVVVKASSAISNGSLLTDVVAHSNAGNGLVISGSSSSSYISVKVSGALCYRNNARGIFLSNNANQYMELSLDGCEVFGNATTGIGYDTGANSPTGTLAITNSTFNAGSTLTQPSGFQATGAVHIGIFVVFDSCSFGSAQTHSTADIQNGIAPRMVFRNCTLASSTEFSVTIVGGFIQKQKHDGTSGNDSTVYPNGAISRDTTIFDTTPSQRLTPNSGSSSYRKLRSAPIRIPVASGQTLTPSVKVRTSVSGDGAAYNGNRARLVLEANGALGITSDTVIDTATAASDGAWETLTGTTATASEDGVMTFYVDCDGTAGWINVDTITVT